MTKQKQEQDGMDFPHDLPRKNGKQPKPSNNTPPKHGSTERQEHTK